MTPRVLIVDDDAATRRAMSKIANRLGYQAETAGNVEEALHKDGPFARILVDLNLPDGLGTTILQHVRATQPHAKIAVISATTDTDLLDFVRLLAPDAIFVKPISVCELTAWLTTNLSGAGPQAVTAI